MRSNDTLNRRCKQPNRSFHLPNPEWFQQHLVVTKGRATLIHRVLSFLPSLTSAQVSLLGTQMLSWKTKKDQTLKPTSIQTLLSALSTGVRMLTGKDTNQILLTQYRTVRARLRTHVRDQAVPMTLVDMKRLIRMAPKPELKARLALTWALGLRCSDSKSIRCSDILQLTHEACLLRLRGAKGAIPGSESYFRATPLLGLTECLKEYLVKMVNSKGLLFPSTQISQMLRAIKKSNNVYSGHSLRRGAATALANAGYSTEYIRIFLGHQSIQSTRLYVQPNLNQIDWKKRTRSIASTLL